MPTLYGGGLVFDGAGKLLEDHGVLVDGNRIQRLAPMAEFDGFSDERVDTNGGTLLPGLIDCHVHLVFAGEPDPWAKLASMKPGEIVLRALEHAQAALRRGVTSLRDCGGKDYLEFAVRDACNSGRFLGPTIRAAGRIICMTGGHGSRMGRVADGIEDVVKAVREQIHAGADLIKIMATGGIMTPGVDPEDTHYSAEEMAAGIAEGHRFKKPCASHAQGRDGILNAVRGGVESIEHGIFLDELCIEEMTRNGTYLVPTLSALDGILGHGDEGIPAYMVDKARRVAERQRQSVKMFYEAGGRLAMGTDAGTPFNFHGDNAGELGRMVDVGVSAADALTAATSNAAGLNRLEDRGRIAEGLRADLLIVDGNPLQDIARVAVLANHRCVVKDGVMGTANPRWKRSQG